MDNTCKVCQKTHDSEAGLHRHLKAHKMSQVEYYQTFYPRYDMYDGKIIRFKNREFYLSSDFNSRQSMTLWFKSASVAAAKSYVQEFLLARKARKQIKYTPSQVELRSLPIPGMLYLNQLVGDYDAFCEKLGFVRRFDAAEFGPLKRFNARQHILCDTREQQPLTFPTLVRNYEALKFGDYRLNDDDFTHNCCIERKALGDFYTTVSSGYLRFIKEIERCQEAGFYLVVVVESGFETVYSYPIGLSAASGHALPSPEYVFHNMREICQKYPFVQFLFVKNREESAKAIEHIFRSDGAYKRVDLQYLYDKGKLI